MAQRRPSEAKRVIHLDTSLRTVPVAETWNYLQRFRSAFGVTRVTDTTRLDRVGVPVFAAIRPTAERGSLCVASGKALTTLDASTGSLCEAIEFASAELDPERDRLVAGSVGSFEAQFDLDIYDFCVQSEHLKRCSPDTPIELVEVHEHFSGETFLIPATLVFFPHRDPTGTALLGRSSNGLSGGNSRIEALFHAVLELLERDTLSFARVSRLERRLIDVDEPRWQDLACGIEAAGLTLYVTFCENSFRLPMFICYLFDPNHWSGVSVARGQGLHLDKGIALLRATTEALQSRLTNIHGARDDIVNRFLTYRSLGPERERRDFERLEEQIQSYPTIDYDDVYSNAIEPYFESMASRLFQDIHDQGFRYLFYADLTKHMASYHVVRAVIPGLEYFSTAQPRVGKRLLHHVENSR